MKTTDPSTHPLARLFAAAIPLALMLSACDSDCRPTAIALAPVAMLDTGEVERSMVLEGTLTVRATGAPLARRPMTFWLLRRGPGHLATPRWTEVGIVRTDERGTAVLDLKQRPAHEVAWDATATRVGATFAGTRRYCATRTERDVQVARVGAPVPPAPLAPADDPGSAEPRGAIDGPGPRAPQRPEPELLRDLVGGKRLPEVVGEAA